MTLKNPAYHAVSVVLCQNHQAKPFCFYHFVSFSKAEVGNLSARVQVCEAFLSELVKSAFDDMNKGDWMAVVRMSLGDKKDALAASAMTSA